MKTIINIWQSQKKFSKPICFFLIKTSWLGFAIANINTGFAKADIAQSSYPSIFRMTEPAQVEPTQKNGQNPQNQPHVETVPRSRKPRRDSSTQLTLKDVVFLAIANNTEIKNAYLERIAQKQDLAVAEDKFVPDLTPRLSFSTNRLGEDSLETTGEVGTNFEVRVPTGATLDFEWTGNAGSAGSSGLITERNNDFFGQNFNISISQPLFKGAGIRINRASVDIARLNEQSNIVSFKSTLVDTITSAITTYRELFQAQERVKIEQLALQNAQESLKVTQALIAAGRVAQVDIVQNQANIANRRVSLLQAKNQLQSRKAALLQVLDIDKNINIEAETISEVKPVRLNLEKLQQVALANRPNYLLSKISVNTNELNLLLAKDEKRWDLSLNASMSDGVDQQTDARAGVSLSRTIGDLTLNQRYERARVELLQAQNSLEDSRNNLAIELQDRARDVNLSFSQLELARRATQLSQRQLEIEQEKRRLGRGTGIFQLINLQDSLAQARNAELDATIRYLNSLTNLDQFLGTTLQTWQIEIKN